MLRWSKIILALVGTVSIASCSTEATDDVELNENPLLKGGRDGGAVELSTSDDEQDPSFVQALDDGDDQIVKFFVGEDGSRLVTETTTKGRKLILNDCPTANPETLFADYFKCFRPGKEVPASLVDADKRAKRAAEDFQMLAELTDEPPDSTGEENAPDADLIPKHATSSCDHFKADGMCRVNNNNGPICRCNIINTNVSYSKNGMSHSYWGVGNYLGGGTVNLVIKVASTQFPTINVNVGNYWGGVAHSPYGQDCSNWGGCNSAHYKEVTHKGWTTDSTDNSYHFAACWSTDIYGQGRDCSS